MGYPKTWRGREGKRRSRKAGRFKRYRRVKQAVLDAKKNGCFLCEEKYAPALEFHHVKPETKRNQRDVASQAQSFANVEKQKRVCVVLCSNCHRKLHGGFFGAEIAKRLLLISEERLATPQETIPGL
jgi:5-methylcytosine-specific restriction endonuclease McrA